MDSILSEEDLTSQHTHRVSGLMIRIGHKALEAHILMGVLPLTHMDTSQVDLATVTRAHLPVHMTPTLIMMTPTPMMMICMLFMERRR